MNENNITRVRLCFERRRQRAGHDELLCVLGRDITCSAESLEAFCFRQMSVLDEELILLAGVVAYADRMVKRHTASGWLRRIHIVMPVGNQRVWSNQTVVLSLQEALAFITGDVWTFEFERRPTKLPKLRQREFHFGDQHTVVIPFSNGLDSFAQSKLLRAEGITATPIRLTASNNGISGDRNWVTDPDGQKYPRVSVPFHLEVGTHPELSYRTRSFVFAALAGVAAHVARSQFVLVPEAGQGSFGPSLVPVGGESPHRGSHPGFTMRMTHFLGTLFGGRVEFRHPQIWRTKGQVMGELRKRGLEGGWKRTRSCSQGARQIHTARGTLIQCGLCAGCLLRRVSISAGGLDASGEEYFWTDLNAPSLERAICSDAGRAPTKNDHDIAFHAVMGMEALARLEVAGVDELMIKQNLLDAYPADELDTAEKKLRSLLAMHRDEWNAFKSRLRPDSWVNVQAGTL